MNMFKCATIGITVTEQCNCSCKYCFETNRNCTIKPEKEHRELQLIQELCDKIPNTIFSDVYILFWGGEPFLNYDYIETIIQNTCKNEHIFYIFYTNGTLKHKFIEFFNSDIFKLVQKRCLFRVSYDGEPHNTLLRGDHKENICWLLKELEKMGNIPQVCATLEFGYMKYLPDIWDSYRELKNNVHCVHYDPILNTMVNDISDLDNFKIALTEVAKKEFYHIKQYGYPLCDWFLPEDEIKRRNYTHCLGNNYIAIDSYGDIYPCYACPNIKGGFKTKINNIFEITSFSDVLQQWDFGEENPICKNCEALICHVCQAFTIDDPDSAEDLISRWNTKRHIFRNRCQFYIAIGRCNRMLYDALKHNDINSICVDILN